MKAIHLENPELSRRLVGLLAKVEKLIVVILGLVPRICNGLIALAWLDPRDKP